MSKYLLILDAGHAKNTAGKKAFEMTGRCPDAIKLTRPLLSGGIAEHIGSRLIQNDFDGEYSIYAIGNEFVGSSTIPSARSFPKESCRFKSADAGTDNKVLCIKSNT